MNAKIVLLAVLLTMGAVVAAAPSAQAHVAECGVSGIAMGGCFTIIDPGCHLHLPKIGFSC